MPASLEVLFTPAEFAALKERDLRGTVCVVFDVLRATSTMVTALDNGAEAVIPVGEISEAVAVRRKRPGVLLAGEREGVRISAGLSGGVEFDLGNSPREFTSEKIGGRTIVMTTTNGTRALRACAHAQRVFLGAFLNLGATADFLTTLAPAELLLVCSGTLDQAAYEDVLGAGALADLLWPAFAGGAVADSALLARRAFDLERDDLALAVAGSRNGRRLSAQPDLRDDVPFCVQRDITGLVAELQKDGTVGRAGLDHIWAGG